MVSAGKKVASTSSVCCVNKNLNPTFVCTGRQARLAAKAMEGSVSPLSAGQPTHRYQCGMWRL
jgi:hypothetical protein